MRKWMMSLLFVIAGVASGVAQAQPYAYRITDPMVGTSAADLNVEFWQPWVAPGGTGTMQVTASGVLVANQLNYLGYFNINNAPTTWWTFGGDFRISIFVSNDVPDRLGVTLREIASCTTLSETNMIGLWGGSSNTPPPRHFYMPQGSGSYYLFAKSGNQLVLRQGSATSVSDSDPIVQGPFTVDPEVQYFVYMGSGNPNSGQMTVRNLDLQTQNLTSCREGHPIPSSWRMVAAPVVAVPALGDAGLAALSLLLGLAGYSVLRRRAKIT